MQYLKKNKNEKIKKKYHKGYLIIFQRIDRLFDVLNSRSPYGKGTKQPIRTENWAEIKTFLLETKDYLTALKTVEGIPLHTSVR